ncbi:hypothetical protein ACHAWO_008060 [Cyclotella atomus]|uniref:tRNA/rRNA methyltransferase SpoU type domain-containing protein n=1 Tax=Cyclotella atomus TaxID=382360 RepID=A0ABD3MQV7_9STRA
MSIIRPHISTRFILINTQKNHNIGSSARAIKTMGFNSLHIVNPYDANVLQCRKTKTRASGADDILRHAKKHSTLTEAIQGCGLVCGTGMPVDMYRKRKEREYIEPRVYFERVLSDSTIGHSNKNSSVDMQLTQYLDIAFLFGCETTGMKDVDMDKCHVMLGIPTNPRFGSLNLASAVQIIAYEWRMALGGRSSYVVTDNDDVNV